MSAIVQETNMWVSEVVFLFFPILYSDLTSMESQCHFPSDCPNP